MSKNFHIFQSSKAFMQKMALLNTLTDGATSEESCNLQIFIVADGEEILQTATEFSRKILCGISVL